MDNSVSITDTSNVITNFWLFFYLLKLINEFPVYCLKELVAWKKFFYKYSTIYREAKRFFHSPPLANLHARVCISWVMVGLWYVTNVIFS